MNGGLRDLIQATFTGGGALGIVGQPCSRKRAICVPVPLVGSAARFSYLLRCETPVRPTYNTRIFICGGCGGRGIFASMHIGATPGAGFLVQQRVMWVRMAIFRRNHLPITCSSIVLRLRHITKSYIIFRMLGKIPGADFVAAAIIN